MKILEWTLFIFAVNVNGEQWSSWIQDKIRNCEKMCHLGFFVQPYRRFCSQETCSGSAIKHVLEFCPIPEICQDTEGWSPWVQTSVTPCSVTCGLGFVLIKIERTCNGTEAKCEGKSQKNITSLCRVELPCAVNGGWSNWISFPDKCRRNCTRVVAVRRQCVNPRPMFGGRNCRGSPGRIHTENCTGHLCTAVYGEWSSWQLTNETVCRDSCSMETVVLSYTRACNDTKGPCVGSSVRFVYDWCNVSNDCPVTEGWSGWTLLNRTRCQESCGMHHMFVIFNRTCLAKLCIGNKMKTLNLTCKVIEPCPVEGGWSPWAVNDSTECFNTCKRKVVYTRLCDNPVPAHGGSFCNGSTNKVVKADCKGDHCFKVDGGWSRWQIVGSRCTTSCGTGVRTVLKERFCNKPSPQFGGSLCVGKPYLVLVTPCRKNQCTIPKIDNVWTNWRQIGSRACPVTCGTVRRTRVQQRLCIKRRCADSYIKTEYTWCNANVSCPVKSGWTGWTLLNTTDCLVTCGNGFRVVSFRRRCKGDNCEGSTTKRVYGKCQVDVLCPVHGGWGSWENGKQSLCSHSCGTGTYYVYYFRRCDHPSAQWGGRRCVSKPYKLISQHCYNNESCSIAGGAWSPWVQVEKMKCKPCFLEDIQLVYVRYCLKGKCEGRSYKYSLHICQPERGCPTVGGWTAWRVLSNGGCTVSCGLGFGITSLMRQCTKRKCAGNAYKRFIDICEKNIPCQGAWSSWKVQVSTCDENCRNKTILRRQCTELTLMCFGAKEKITWQSCNGNGCPIIEGWTQWRVTSSIPCTATCGLSERKINYVRSCLSEDNKCRGPHRKVLNETCVFDVCPVHGSWSEWTRSRMTDCNVTCGQGFVHVLFIRKCNSPLPNHGGHKCKGRSKITVVNNCYVSGNCSNVASFNNTDYMFGIWSAWTQSENHSFCDTKCRRKVTFLRKCKSYVYGAKYACPGHGQISVKETCTGGKCLTVNGGWSSWNKQGMICSVTVGSGRYEVVYTRKCDKPAPRNGGQRCRGPRRKTETGQCESVEFRHQTVTDGDRHSVVVMGDWGPWLEPQYETCSPTCDQHVGYSRRCVTDVTNVTDALLDCHGHSKLVLVVSCSTGNCRTVDGQWSSWQRHQVGLCHAVCLRSVSRIRTCTDPPPKGKGMNCFGSSVDVTDEECSGDKCVDGQWTSWTVQSATKCGPTCVLGVLSTRTCTNPPPSQGGKQCEGNQSRNSTNKCVNTKCGHDKPGSSYSSLVILGTLSGVFAVVLVIYFVSRTKSQSRERDEEENASRKRINSIKNVLASDVLNPAFSSSGEDIKSMFSGSGRGLSVSSIKDMISNVFPKRKPSSLDVTME